MTWERKTFHECAAELEGVSETFRQVFLSPPSTHGRAIELKRSSILGVELLRMLALAVRSEQDSGLVPYESLSVGVIKTPITSSEVIAFKQSYRPPYGHRSGFLGLSLREGLNKIAHTDVNKTAFAVDVRNHDLLLSGEKGGKMWMAILSVPALCRSVRSLPDWTVPTEVGRLT
jgi:hypothetical protein